MRLVRVKLLPGKSGEMLELYRDRILPELREADGCLFAALTESAKDSDECVSLTLWDSREHIADYEEGGRYHRLLEEAQPYLAESGEWRVQLSDDLNLEYGPVKEPPKATAFRLDAGMSEQPFADLEKSAALLRVIRLPIEPSRASAMKERYEKEVIPALRQVAGCLYAGLLVNTASEGQFASMTIWASREAAEAYERSELFRELMRSAREVVGARSWDLMLQNQSPGPEHPEKGVIPRNYTVIAGRDLRG